MFTAVPVMLAAVLLGSSPITPSSPGASVQLSVESTAPGQPVPFSGHGFVPPRPDRCEIALSRTALHTAWCDVHGSGPGTLRERGLRAGILLPKSVSPGEHRVTICVPRCGAGRIAGSTSVLTVRPKSSHPIRWRRLEWQPKPRSVATTGSSGEKLAASPDPAGPGDLVVLSDPSQPGAGSFRCVVQLDGDPAGDCSADGRGVVRGALTIPAKTLTLPAKTEPDSHWLRVCVPDCVHPTGGADIVTVQVRGQTLTTTSAAAGLNAVPQPRPLPARNGNDGGDGGWPFSRSWLLALPILLAALGVRMISRSTARLLS
jgi:hypothetical protein